MNLQCVEKDIKYIYIIYKYYLKIIIMKKHNVISCLHLLNLLDIIHKKNYFAEFKI